MLLRKEEHRNVILLDGFPRSPEQERWARSGLALQEGKGEFPDGVVYFSCAKEVLKETYVARKRGMDDGSLFEKRFEQHERECRGVVKVYRGKGVLVKVSFRGFCE
ncbi:hypothetical protein B0T16DRAFT_171004 [Cercophora newfieldiana]|uniref:Adenylate kinase n=1 Tax=Cercophora newfieldiana TaxID=92897 RepID=A0AA39Y6M7_9PEZI|nr:hypothetical protein B0T16DRAFT_171004 [Cercophora newfieldiana]